MANFCFVYADRPIELNCSKFNAINPANAINKFGNGNQAICMHVDQFSQNDENTRNVLMQADLIILERNFFGDTLTSLMFYKVRGKKILAIFDDAYNYMHPNNVSYGFWHDGIITYNDGNGDKQAKMYPHPMDQFKWGMKMVCGIQVPSPYLAKDWESYNKTYYIPNYIEFEKYVDVKPYFPHKKKDIIIGWGGSMSHVESFTDSHVLDALKIIAKKYDNVVKVVSNSPPES